MYNFVIIGGGIVGLSAAMAISQHYPKARIAVLVSIQTTNYCPVLG